MKIKEQIEQRNIASNNFFRLLKEKKKTQRDFANYANLDESTVSKWKKDGLINIEYIRLAATFLEVLVNDLVYSSEEQKVIEVRFTNETYQPIKAQQVRRVKHYSNVFDKPLLIIMASLVIFGLFLFAVLVSKKNDSLITLLLITGIPLIYFLFRTVTYEKRTFIINFPDDIYYKRDSSTHKNYRLSKMFHYISLLLTLFYFYPIRFLDTEDNSKQGYIFTLVILIILLAYGTINTLIDVPKRFKLKIYEYEMTGYFSSAFLFLVHMAIFFTAILFCTISFKNHWIFLLISGIFLLINSINFYKISKEYSKYTLVYQEDIKEPKEILLKELE